MKETSTTSCVVRGCLDAEKPVQVRIAEIYQWPNADSELLSRKSDILNGQDGKLSSTTNTINTSYLKYYDRERYYASRQNFLRSYKFTEKKETLGTRAKKWLKRKPKTLIKSQINGSSSGSRGGGPRSSVKGAPSCFIVSCIIKLKVHD
ncbi:hypothetical protein PanWU01x14_046180 [Parasponia andersonii]|uniref:Uncharacterized protein n=1 Tax=Parasponia andersonii TaxID=3476 RepID=A0A2P5DNP8_PARAD|nr:hypothetical protein PanWU01x14_046180 [Parasponia andersonii]